MAFDNGTLLQVVAPKLSLRNPGSTCDSHTYKAKSTQNMNFVKTWKREDMQRYTRNWSRQIRWTSGYTTSEAYLHRCATGVKCISIN